MAKAKPAAPQTLRHAAASLAVQPDGSFFFACGPGAYLNGGWNGFGRFDAASGKVAKVEAPFSGPIALAGGDVVGLERAYVKDHFDYVLKRADAATGALQATFEKVEFEVEGIAVSPNGQWIAAVGKSDVAVFDPAGRKVAALRAQAATFTGPDELFHFDYPKAVRRNLATGQETSLDIQDEVSLYGALRLRDGWLLSPTGSLFEVATGRARQIGGGKFCWGVEPNTLMRATRVGMVEVLDLEGKVLRSFARPRGRDILEGWTAAGWYVLTTGNFIERYPMAEADSLPAQRAERKAPAPRKPVTSAADGDVRAAELLQAYFDHPDDPSLLAVWADLLAEHGDPRGEFVQLHLLGEKATKEQNKRLESLRRNGGGAMVGPAREYLRTWRFGMDGLVEEATCEAQKLAEGFAQIAMLSPVLSLRVTSLAKKTKATVAALAKLPLGRIPTLILSSNSISDASLKALAPALSGVRSLWLDGNDLTAEGLLEVLAQLKGLRELEVDYGLNQDRAFREAVVQAVPSLESLNQQKVR